MCISALSLTPDHTCPRLHTHSDISACSELILMRAYMDIAVVDEGLRGRNVLHQMILID